MIIGLTGGIGSGKSVVAKLFEMMGCALFNSDAVAKDAYYLSGVREQVTALLGHEAYSADGSINKTYISAKIFGDTDQLHRLNAIIHPAVKAEFLNFQNKQERSTIIVKESALLFEAKIEHEVDRICVVSAPEHIRIARVMQRDHITEEEVRKRIKSQMPQEEKVKKAHLNILNDEQHSLIEQVTQVLHTLRN
ncbi:MAG TPA: dephospho-CoA kinase [Bacteroidia bacterium]|nr:dephospho-CoA kinase [Bacteroidia bacterium]